MENLKVANMSYCRYYKTDKPLIVCEIRLNCIKLPLAKTLSNVCGYSRLRIDLYCDASKSGTNIEVVRC